MTIYEMEKKKIAEEKLKEGVIKGKIEGKMEGKIEGKIEGINLTLQIIESLKKEIAVKDIAMKFHISENQVNEIKSQLSL